MPKYDTMKTRLIISDPDILGGIPVFAGTRVPVKNLTDYLEAGDSINEFLDDFPSVSRTQVIEFLEEARAQLTAAVA
jgi:uncharacterized protein (DUF433 family)